MPEERPLSAHVLAAVQALLEKAAKLHSNALCLEGHARTLVAQDAQIDLDKEAWNLDVFGGRVYRTQQEYHDGAEDVIPPPPND